jgi:hypothetical protein
MRYNGNEISTSAFDKGFPMFGTTKLSTIRKKLEEARSREANGESDRRIPKAKLDEGKKIMEELERFMQRAREFLRDEGRTHAYK